MGEYITTKNDRTLFVHDTPGREEGTIVAVHGLTGNHNQFHHYQQELSGTYRFISYDLCGRGNSEQTNSTTSIFTHTDDLIDLIETLNIERPILMGYSMGGYICALAAKRLPNVEKLILLDGAGVAEESQRELIVPSLNRLKKNYSSAEDYVEDTKNLYTTLNVSWNARLEEIARYEITGESTTWKHKSDYTLTLQDFESFYLFSPKKVLPFISCATLLVIATGNMGTKPALFDDSSYIETKQHIRHLQTVSTPVNHYELVFNKQDVIEHHIQHFLREGGERHEPNKN